MLPTSEESAGDYSGSLKLLMRNRRAGDVRARSSAHGAAAARVTARENVFRQKRSLMAFAVDAVVPWRRQSHAGARA
jgi:hypothetical protein